MCTCRRQMRAVVWGVSIAFTPAAIAAAVSPLISPF